MTSFYGGGAASTSGGESIPIKGALIFKGTLGISDDGATVLVLPDEHEEGWTYLVVTAGTYAGQLCEKGDFVICVSSGEAASDLDWTVVQGNTFNTLPTPTALDEGKIISVDTSGNYVLIDNPSSGETENLPDPSEADEGKILSVGADGNYILTDNSAKDKLDKANPTYTGSLTGENATFTGSVQVSTPAADGEAVNKGYVDATKTELEGDINTLQQTVTSQTETINTLNQQVTNITGGTVELPYLKNTGDSGTGVYDFTGATVNAADPVDNSNVATKHYVDQKIASAGGEGEVVSYTQGNGINISPENIISAVVDADNANGLVVDTSGIKLNVATPTTAGAMSGADKAKLDATSTTEQMNQAISSAIDETLEDPTKLPFVNINGDTMHGSLTTTELFTDFVTIRNAGTDGNTGFQNNSDTDHIRVYDKVADTLVPIEVGEPVNNQDASTKKYVDDKVTTETAARTEAIESLDEAKADKNNPTFTGIISGANATLSGTLTGNTATFSGGITVPLEPGAEGSATSKKYVDDQIAAIDIEPLTQRVTTAEGEIDTLQSDIINITNGTTELPYIPSDGGTISGPINWGGNPQEATELANKAYVDANDSDAVNSAKEYTNAQIEIAKGYTDEAVTNLTNGTTKLPYVTKEEVDIAADTRDVARAYRYTFNDGLDGINSNAGFGFIDFTPAIVTEKDGSTSFSPLYVGEPKKDTQAATKKYVDDAIAAVDAPEYTLAKQTAAEDGYVATYYLTKDGAQVGEKINIPKDYLVKEAELLEVAVTDTPYSGAVIGDKYIDFTINTQASDEDEQHIYLPVKDLVDVYTGGNGININASNVVSVQIDAANANGLALGSAGFKLNLATTSAAGAMSVADKTKLDTAISEEQLTAVENEIDTLQTEVNNIKSGTTDLGYLKAANPTYTGTLNGVNATFTGDVIVPTPDGDTEAANKSYVDSAIDTTETALREDISEVQQNVMQQTGTIDILSQTITGITQGTMALPYVKKAGDTMSGELVIDTTTAEDAFNGHTTIGGGCARFGDSEDSDYAVFVGVGGHGEYPAIDFEINEGAEEAIRIQPETTTAIGVKTDSGDYANVRVADPVEDNHAATKNYVDKAAIQRANDKIDAVYNSLVKKAESVDEVNQLFKDWWNANWEEGSSTYNDMLERWFGKVLDDDKVYGVKLPLFETSTSPQGEYIEDSVGATVTPATEEGPGQNDFAKTPQFWCVEVAAEKNADGSHTIYACEYIDDIDVVRNGGPDNGKHLVWVLQKNTYIHEYEKSGYSYIKIQCHPADDFVQWPQGTDRTGHTYSYIANPKYAAGIDDEGNIGCRTGLKPTCYMSMNQTIQAWRARGPQYSGSSACFYKWAYIMYALLNAKKGEDVGCNKYDYQYAAAVSESGVSRIILTADQANNLYVGSNVIIGNTEGSNDRGQAAMYNLVKLRKISSIEEVSIEEDASSYKAVYIDVPDGTTFDTLVGITYISTMPFYSGWTDSVKGTIGTKYGINLNKQPFLLQKVELMNGAYNYASDELDQWSQQDDTHYLYDFYLCEDQTKVSTNGTITDDYIKKENATLTIDTAVYTTNRWYYVEDNLTDNNFKMLSPKKFSTSAGSGTGTRDAFYLSYAASGVRMPIVWAGLWNGGLAGLSCRASRDSPSWAYWYCAGGCPGLSG